jgi:acyl transferase domain-containing protein/NADPH:quinone reductase-like Zn-dependent oxidoreductase/acyl carrier protein
MKNFAKDNNETNPTQKALLAVKAMRKKLEQLQHHGNEPLAVIGMSCRLPGGVNSPEAFWDLLLQKKDAITDIPSDRWNIHSHYDADPAEPGKMYVKQGGFIDDVYHFDNELFGLSKRESVSMDPQQRLLLELSWEALERAGIAPRKAESRKNTGLFIGIATNDYARFHMHSNNLDDIDVYSFTGSAPSIASGRISQLLDLGGPTLSIDTACSSSIVALHLARQSILNDECETALVGGINLMLSPENTVYFCKTSALSPDNRCKTFDENANGYVRSEGGGILVLKRLSKALEDNDNILAVLMGSAINHDGEGIGLTAPNGDSQQRLVEKALKNSSVSLHDISYIETHGTGTPLGDPIELQALGRVFAERKEPIAIGSCKSNIGHTEAAAGIAGIIKTILCLQQKTLAPNLHFDQPSSFIPWQRLPLRVVKDAEPWQLLNGKRIAGVSSFGFSGTNSHAIFGEAPIIETLSIQSPSTQPASTEGNKIRVLALSGKTASRLNTHIKQTLEFLERNSDLSLDAFCYSANKSKFPFKQRIAIEFSNYSELKQRLSTYLGSESTKSTDSVDIHVGSVTDNNELAPLALELRQSTEVLDELFNYFENHSPLFKKKIERCVAAFNEQGVSTDVTSADIQHDAIYLAEYQHYPKLFGRYYAWISTLDNLFGCFDYVSAEGISALAAAAYAGELSFDEAIAICSAFVRGKNVVIASKQKNHALTTSCIIDGKSANDMRSFDYWYTILTNTNRSATALSDFNNGNPLTLINCSSLTARLTNAHVISLTELSTQPEALQARLAAALFVKGHDIDWNAFYAGENVTAIAVPLSPFERNVYRLENQIFTENHSSTHVEKDNHPVEMNSPLASLTLDKTHPLLGTRVLIPHASSVIFQQRLMPGQVPFLLDHGFLKQVVVPATAYLEIISSAILSSTSRTEIHLDDVVYHAGLYLPEHDAVYIQVTLSGDALDQVELYSAAEQDALENPTTAWTLHCSATLNKNFVTSPKHVTIEPLLAAVKATSVVENFYPDLNNYGYLFGPAHQGVTHIAGLADNSRVALVRAHSSIDAEFERYYFHPAHMDSCCHAILDLFNKDSKDSIFITVGKDQVHFLKPAEKNLVVKAILMEKTDSSIKANLEIYNLRGECIAYVEGYTMKRVARTALGAHNLPKSTLDASQVSQVSTAAQHPTEIDNWLYSTHWQLANVATAAADLTGSSWIICGAASQQNLASAQSIMSLILNAGGAVKLVAEDEVETAVAQLASTFSNRPRGIIHLDAGYTRPGRENTDQLLTDANHAGYFYLARLMRAIPIQSQSLQLISITKGAMNVDNSEPYINLTGAAIWGANRSAILEREDIDFANIDLDPSFPIEAGCPLLQVFATQYPGEDQFALRDGKLFVNRLVPIQKLQILATSKEGLNINFKDNFKLSIDEQGSIENLYYKTAPVELLGDDEVEIEVTAAALNFYDIVTALDLIDTSIVNGKENDECRFGLDAVGRITRTGAQVNDYKVGDWVLGFAPGCMAKYVKVHQDCITHKPDNFGINESATIPTAFLTAYYALVTLAKMQRGDKVLIHAAAGGVGIAAINLANIMGVEVYATASKPKWPLLRSLGVKHIYNSRTLDFAEQLLADTQGEGVDIVLNSFIGDYITKNVDVLKIHGRFVEIGEREILTEAQVKAFNKPFTYYPFTLFEISRDHPEQIKAMFKAMAPLWQSESFTGIPFQEFAATDIKQAFRMMQQGLHKGKLVISLCAPERDVKLDCNIKTLPAVLITGGMGGIGWALAKWLAKTDVQEIYVMGRSPLNDSLLSKINSLSAAGKVVEYLCGDVTKPDDVKKAIDHITAKSKRLGGIFHAAGVMQNALMVHEDAVDAEAVLSAKTLGTWNLHQATQELDLDCFACFSSMTSVLGAAGAASYAAGNAFLDSIVRYRKGLGLPAQAINWGAWADVGMLTRLNESAQEYWRENGMQALSTATALDVLDELSKRPHSNVAVLPANWALWNKQYTKLPSVLRDIEQQRLVQTTTSMLQTNPAVMNGGVVSLHNLVIENVRKVIRLDSSAPLNEETSFREMGIDSLMSVELRNILSKALGKKLSSTLLFNYSNIGSLVSYLQTEFPAHTKVAADMQASLPAINVKSLVVDQLKTLLRLRPNELLNEQEPFKNMGIDSLMSVELRNILSKKLGVKLSSTILFNYTDIASLVAHLQTLVTPDAPPPVPLTTEHKVVPESRGSSSNDMELEELRALLDEKLLEMED